MLANVRYQRGFTLVTVIMLLYNVYISPRWSLTLMTGTKLLNKFNNVINYIIKRFRCQGWAGTRNQDARKCHMHVPE